MKEKHFMPNQEEGVRGRSKKKGQELGKCCLGLHPPLSALADQTIHGLFLSFLTFNFPKFLFVYFWNCPHILKKKSKQKRASKGETVGALSPQVPVGRTLSSDSHFLIQDTDPLKGRRPPENPISLIIIKSHKMGANVAV